MAVAVTVAVVLDDYRNRDCYRDLCLFFSQLQDAWLQTIAVAGISEACLGQIRQIWRPLEDKFGIELTIPYGVFAEHMGRFTDALDIQVTKLDRQVVHRPARLEADEDDEAIDVDVASTEVGVHMALQRRIQSELNFSNKHGPLSEYVHFVLSLIASRHPCTLQLSLVSAKARC